MRKSSKLEDSSFVNFLLPRFRRFVLTGEEEAGARLAKLEAERAAERARWRERRARNKTKARMSSSASSTGDALVTITEAMHLSHRLLAIFQQPPPTVNAHAKLPRPQQSELVQPMAVATVEILHEAIHCVNALVDAAPGTVPRDHEAHTHTPRARTHRDRERLSGE